MEALTKLLTKIFPKMMSGDDKETPKYLSGKK